MKAFELSTKYRNPVVVLADAVLGQMAEPLRFPKEAIEPKIDESWAVRGNKETMNNLVTSIFLDFNQLEEFNFQIQEKYETIRQNEVVYEEYMVEDAEIVIVAYGTSSRLSRTAVDVAREKGIKLGLLRPITLFPFPEKRIKELADKGVQFVSVEMSNGQLREDVKAAANYDDVHLVNRMGGNVIELKDILNEIYKMVGSDERHKVHSDEKDYDASYLNDKEYQEELDNDNYYNHRVVD
jgi:2-oxoisovalerate ferredoxin oxidoreductase alpha subunit